MKTKELIKLLQEADPSGEAHVRMIGGTPVSVEIKEGYWDGSYTYFDDDGNLVESTDGSKVDIRVIDSSDFLERHYDEYKSYDENWNNVISKHIFKFSNMGRGDERKKEHTASIKKQFDEWHEYMMEHKQIAIDRAIENSIKGWKWYQNKLVDDTKDGINEHMYYTWKIYDENGKLEGSNLWNTEAVLRSGLFERLDNNEFPGYYQWGIKKDISLIYK